MRARGDAPPDAKLPALLEREGEDDGVEATRTGNPKPGRRRRDARRTRRAEAKTRRAVEDVDADETLADDAVTDWAVWQLVDALPTRRVSRTAGSGGGGARGPRRRGRRTRHSPRRRRRVVRGDVRHRGVSQRGVHVHPFRRGGAIHVLAVGEEARDGTPGRKRPGRKRPGRGRTRAPSQTRTPSPPPWRRGVLWTIARARASPGTASRLTRRRRRAPRSFAP